MMAPATVTATALPLLYVSEINLIINLFINSFAVNISFADTFMEKQMRRVPIRDNNIRITDLTAGTNQSIYRCGIALTDDIDYEDDMVGPITLDNVQLVPKHYDLQLVDKTIIIVFNLKHLQSLYEDNRLDRRLIDHLDDEISLKFINYTINYKVDLTRRVFVGHIQKCDASNPLVPKYFSLRGQLKLQDADDACKIGVNPHWFI